MIFYSAVTYFLFLEPFVYCLLKGNLFKKLEMHSIFISKAFSRNSLPTSLSSIKIILVKISLQNN